MIDKTTIEWRPLNCFLSEYKELNTNSQYRPVAVGRYGIRTRESIYSKELAKDYSKNKLIYKGTLTVGMGSVQMDIGILSDDDVYSVSPAYHTYKISGVDYDYLRYCLQCRNTDMFTRYMKRGSRQGKSIDLSRWITYEIPVYPAQAQTEIVERLDSVQRIIDARQQQLSSLDDLIKARFVEMFGDQNYMVRSLADVIVPGAGLSYGIIVPGDYYENGCPMVRPSDFKNNKLDLTNVYRVDPAIEKQYARTRLQGDEILVQVIGQPGQIIPATEECKGMNVTRNLAVVRPNNRLVNRQYLIEYLRSETAQRYLTGSSKQSTLKQLPLSLLKTLEVPIPPMELQAQFSVVVSQIDKSKSVIQKSLDETQLLFDSLMQQYFG